MLTILGATDEDQPSLTDPEALCSEPLVEPIPLISLADHTKVFRNKERKTSPLGDRLAAEIIAAADTPFERIKVPRTAEAAEEARGDLWILETSGERREQADIGEP